MEFDREELERLVSQKLALAEGSVVRAYLKNYGEDAEEIAAAAEEFISARAANNVQALSRQLDESIAARNELEKCLAAKSFELSVNRAIYSLGVKKEYCEDVRLLAAHALDGRADDEGIAQAVASVVERIPAFINAAEDYPEPKLDFAGHRGNFARKDDGAALLQSRLDSARATGDNARSVAIISEAAELGISLR